MTSAPSLQSNNLVISTLLDSRIRTVVQDLCRSEVLSLEADDPAHY